MFKKFNYGFTIVETITVFVIMCIIIITTIGIILQQDKIQEKRINKISKSYYSNIDDVYHQILKYNTSNGIITEIDDKNGDGKLDSNDLRELFNLYMDGENVECSEIGIDLSNGAIPARYFNKAVCSSHSGNIIAGYMLDTDCKATISVKETYIPGDRNIRTEKNACGYIIYGIKGGKGILGFDIFTIALGKIGLK